MRQASSNPSRGLRAKSPLVALWLGERWRLLAIENLLDAIPAGADGSRETRLTVDGVELTVRMPKGPAVARVSRTDGQPILTIPCLAFAAHAILGARSETDWIDVPRSAEAAATARAAN